MAAPLTPAGEAAASASTARGGPSPGLILAVVGFSVFVAADDLTVVSTMLRPIIGDLGLVLPDGLDDAAWIVNAYLIAFVAVMPISGRISDVLGRRRTFVGAYLLFLIGTILIPASIELDEPFGWFLFGRILTAIGGGAMVPIALAVVGDVYPAERRARALGTLGAIETLGWVWGPLYGALLVRFLSWQWQFWLNVPVALIGMALSWWALRDHDRPATGVRLDPVGALLLTVSLVSLNLALLGSAEIQSVNGLDELTGGSRDFRWLYLVAAVSGLAFFLQQRSSPAPLFDRRLFRGRSLIIALIVNFVVGAGLVIAMVDVPLFINSVELDLERAAVRSGWVLSALTAAMALFSYLGGRATERWWYKPPVLAGVAMSTAAYAWMGATWSPDTSYGLFVVQLALLGAGFGLTVAPTTSAVVDAAPADQRGSAASLVMVVRLLGLSVGLSALTAWGLARFNTLRSTLDLPPLTDPDFERALIEAQETLTAQAIAETFTAAAVVLGAGVLASLAMRRTTGVPMDAEHPDDPGATAETLAAAPPVAADAPVDNRELIALARRTNLLLGALALVLAAGLAGLLLTMNRVADAEATAEAALAEVAALRTERDAVTTDRDGLAAEVDTLREDLERVEAGAALYASQLTGFQELVTELGPQVEAGIDEAITGLRDFSESTIAFDVNIDEVIPIDTEVVINRTVEVPIELAVPINQSFDTTIEIDTPLGDIPLDITVPVDIVIPIDETVRIPLDETVPIQDEFPVQLDVPIAIDVGDTELAALTGSLAAGLESLRDVLAGLGG